MNSLYVCGRAIAVLLVSFLTFLSVTQAAPINTDPTSFTVCPVPVSTGQNTLTPSSAQVYWSSPTGDISYYEVQYRAVDNGICTGNTTQSANPWITWPVAITSSSMSLTGLTSNTCYQWQVHAVCGSSGGGDYTTPLSFKTLACTNTATNLQVSSTGFATANLTWTNTAFSYYDFAVLYRVQGTTPWITASPTTSVYSSAFYSLTGLSGNTAYDWEVVRVCSPTESSVATSPSTFTTTTCATPSLFVSSVYSNSATLNWSYPGTATGFMYNLQWKPQSSSTWTVVTGLTTTSYALTGLTNNTAYEYQVQSVCSQSSSSAYSNSTNFITICTIPSSPSETPYAVSADLVWFDNNTTYEVNWRVQGTTTWSSLTAVVTGTNSTRRYSLLGLTAGTTYEWQLRTVCSSTDYSAATTIRTFTTGACSPPTNLVASSFANSANLQWTTPSPGSLYELQWRPQGNPTWNTISNLSGTSPGAATLVTYTLAGLNTSTAYEFQVRVLCTSTTSSTFATPVSFTTTGCTVPTSGGFSTRTATTASVNWFPGGASNYNLRWRPQGGTTWITVNGISSSPYTLTGLTPSTSYEFQVQPVCSLSATSAFSSSFNFSTVGCSAPALSQALVTPTTARLAWTASATSYSVQYRAMPAGSCLSNTTSPSNPWTTVSTSQTATTFGLTGLTAGNCYQWRILSDCNSTTLTSVTGYFTTGCGPAPTGLNTTPITGTTAQLNWDDLGSGVQYEVQYRASTNNALNGTDGCVNNTTSSANPWTTASSVSSNSYMLSSLNLSTCYQWRVRVLCDGSTFSDIIVFRTTSTAPPCQSVIITQQPDASGAVVAGGTASASVVATGTAPLMYQWYKGGTAAGNIVSGQTSATLTISNAQASDASTYFCLVSNSCSSTFSNGFTLSVNSSTCPGGFYTVQNGSWNDVATWSCGQIPTSTDAVEIRHAVNIPDNYTGLTAKITYTSAGQIVYTPTGKVKVGP